MNKTRILSILLVLVFMLAGCTPSGDPAPDADLIATQVAIMLTQSALETSMSPTETLAPTTTEMTAPTQEPTSESTPTTTATLIETPTPTPDQNDPAQRLGAPAYTQDFTGNTSPWDFDSPQAVFATANGYLNLTAQGNANWHSWYVSSPRLKNAYVETTYEMANCSGSDRVGFIVRASSDGQKFYFFSITCDGRWGFFRMAPDVNISEIRGYQQAAPLLDSTAASHRAGIWMDGDKFTFYLDGEEIGTASDSTLMAEGYTGFLIAYSQNPGFTVRIDALKAWNLR